MLWRVEVEEYFLSFLSWIPSAHFGKKSHSLLRSFTIINKSSCIVVVVAFVDDVVVTQWLWLLKYDSCQLLKQIMITEMLREQ